MADTECRRKYCPRCKTERAATEFYPSKQTRDGLYGWCKACQLAKAADAYKARKAEFNARSNRYYAANRDKVRDRIIEYRSSERGREVLRAASRRRYRRPEKLVSDRIRSGLLKALGNKKHGRASLEIIGCTREELVAHIERQFLPGMTWANHGEWHIDHIVPLSSFTIETVDDARRAWALTNLRPLWATDNIRKNGRRTHLL